MKDELKLEENYHQVADRLQNGHYSLHHDRNTGECESLTNHQGDHVRCNPGMKAYLCLLLIVKEPFLYKGQLELFAVTGHLISQLNLAELFGLEEYSLQ